MAERYAGSTAHLAAIQRLGFPTRLNTRVVEVSDASATRVLDLNPRRLFWLLVNRGVDDVSLRFESYDVDAFGILATAYGGIVSASVDEDGEAVTYEVWAQSLRGSVPLYVVEVVTD